MHALSAANALMQIDHARLIDLHEASWSNIGDIIANYTTIIGEKESKINDLQAKLAELPDTPLNTDARSKSRLQKHMSILAVKRTSTPDTAYVFALSEDFPALQAKKKCGPSSPMPPRHPKSNQ